MRSPYIYLAFSAVLTACAIGIVVEGVRSATDVGVLLLLAVHARREYQRATWGFLTRRFIRRIREFFSGEAGGGAGDRKAPGDKLRSVMTPPPAGPDLDRWTCPVCGFPECLARCRRCRTQRPERSEPDHAPEVDREP